MALNNKVVWLEGMFIRPQHFQQQDRYFEHLLKEKQLLLNNYCYGLSEIQFDPELLNMGRISLLKCAGMLPDGTLFNLPTDQSTVEILTVPENTRDTLVYLALPLTKPNVTEISSAESKSSLTRYVAEEGAVTDNSSAEHEGVNIYLGKLRLHLLLEGSGQLGQFAYLPIARITEIGVANKIVLDPDFIPTCLHCASSSRLAGYLTELRGLLEQRADFLSAQLGDVKRSTSLASVADFLLLQLINNFSSLTEHLAKLPILHPEFLYRVLIQFASELAVFCKGNKRPIDFPVYNHDNLTVTFAPIIDEIRRELATIIEQIAIMLPLEQKPDGINTATITKRSIFDEYYFVIRAKADMESKELADLLPAQIKVGSVEDIKKLVSLQLPGVSIRLLPVAPPQLPYTLGSVYFELEAIGDLWDKLKKSAGFAIHVGGYFPNLRLELWAIKRE
jgi:type VI secretion system protein ImpJ